MSHVTIFASSPDTNISPPNYVFKHVLKSKV